MGAPNDKLTEAQLKALIGHVTPIIQQYAIPYENIVSHADARNSYIVAHPDRKYTNSDGVVLDVYPKADTTPENMEMIRQALIQAGVYSPKN